LEGISRENLARRVTKDARIEVRATEAEKEEIQRTAALFGLSVGEYLMTLHRLAIERLQDKD
jgi:uncharacterized protein (DUF1778 family)